MSAITFSALYLPLLLSALAFLISIISFFVLRSYVRRRTSREWIIQEGILKEIREEVNALLRSIDETTDRNITLIKGGEENLKSTLGEVEKRLKVYIREMEKRPRQEETYKSLLASTSPDRSPIATNSEGAGDGMYVDLGKLRYSIKRQDTIDTSSSASIPMPAAEPKPVEPKVVTNPAGTPPAREQINTLFKAGFSAPVIASRLGLSITEVEFVTELLQRREEIT